MIFKNHKEFYETMGGEAVQSASYLITHEEHYQHIKARIAKETAEDVLQAVSELLGLEVATKTTETA